MKLAVFDIDGTLTNTNGVDDECFVKALEKAHAISGINTNWAEYPHTTDSGILLHIFQERAGRDPVERELVEFKRCFINLLAERCQSEPSSFAEIDGAATALKTLARNAEWAVAIATGCWRESALLKLRAAQIDFDEVPAAYAEDGLSREEILEAAISAALKRNGQGSFEKIVSIGDGIWDVRAARRLHLPFLGIGSGAAAARLRQAGATHVLEDFTDYAKLMSALNAAEVPVEKNAV